MLQFVPTDLLVEWEAARFSESRPPGLRLVAHEQTLPATDWFLTYHAHHRHIPGQ